MRELCYFLVVVAALILWFCRGSCVSEDVAVRAIKAHGYEKIEVIEHAWFAVGFRGCSGSDAARFTVRAKNPAGKSVETYICSGWLLKSATLRVP